MSNNTLLRVFLLLNGRGVLTQSTSPIHWLAVHDKWVLSLAAAMHKQIVYIGGADNCWCQISHHLFRARAAHPMVGYFGWLLVVHNFQSSGGEECWLHNVVQNLDYDWAPSRNKTTLGLFSYYSHTILLLFSCYSRTILVLFSDYFSDYSRGEINTLHQEAWQVHFLLIPTQVIHMNVFVIG